MQATVRDLIRDALTQLMVYSPDIILTAEEENTALRTLNGLIESVSNEPIALNSITKEDFNLVGGQQVYTWGTGGNFNSARPVSIKFCTTAVAGTSGNIDFPVAIVNYDDYASIKLKTLQTNYPQYVYIDGAYPLNNVYFYPVPSSAVPVTFYSYKTLVGFDNITQSVSLPQGYYRFLMSSLAVELAPSYQVTASQNIIDIRNEARRNIVRTNAKNLTMQTDAALLGTGGRYNIFSDKCSVR